MLISLVGAPNKGKSTLFSALTMNEVAIADYPFTTVDPNLGLAYATKPCAETELKVKCKPRNSLCNNGTRMIPVNIVDVAGLVEGAHTGKGMGNQFLSDISASDAVIIVADISGKTDNNGNPATDANPVEDVKIVIDELAQWVASIVKKHLNAISRRNDAMIALGEVLTNMKATAQQVEAAAGTAGLAMSKIHWTDQDILNFSMAFLKLNKPIIIAANKSDAPASDKGLALLKAEFGESNVVATSGAIELALRKAAKQGLIDYAPGSKSFNFTGNVTPEQKAALEYMLKFVNEKGTNVQALLNGAVFGTLANIVVYPVEDENKYCDHSGNVLPDAILMRNGSTAIDLAEKIHTDIAKNMLHAVDAKTKRRLAKQYPLQDGDVIRIVSAAR
ncbi:MAG TPA: YchF-related putative GTPase [Candidatus Baltobacteraceae bacterium]|nr:YchF-related putative GTPase [Candidatus Baltobacteraceae bacterium]